MTDERRTATRPVGSSASDQVRLVARVARMYHEQDMRQTQIAERLHISQAKVSRLLSSAVELGIVRTVVSLPLGTHAELEEAIEEHYGIAEVVIADVHGTDPSTLSAVGNAAARYLESTLTKGDVVGISSWSESLLRTIDSMRTVRGTSAESVVQMVGGLGNPRVQVLATHMMERFARILSAEQVYMLTPAVLGSAQAREELVNDPALTSVVSHWKKLSVALVGVGALVPSPMLQHSGNISDNDDRNDLAARGAVGDVCLRYFDRDGALVRSGFDERVMGISAEDYLSVPRRIAVCGGLGKLEAIRAALRGGWANVLITDSVVAESLLEEARTESG